MHYQRALYVKAKNILDSRKNDAEMQAQLRAQNLRERFEEIDSIQTQLSRLGLQLSRLFLEKGNTEEKVNSLREKSTALVERRSQILKENGFSPDALLPDYTCPVCKDTGFVDGRMCTCHKNLLKELQRAEINKLAPLDDCTFENFCVEKYSDKTLQNTVVPRERAEKILDVTRKYAQNFTLDSKNLLFLGKTGLGKTHLSLSIANVVISRGYSVCYGTSQNICDDLQSEQFGREPMYYTKKMVLQSDLLVLDDLGTEVENQYSVAIIYDIINHRILTKKPTIISTNFDFSQLLKKYDQRITSRLSGEYLSLQLLGKDIRYNN